MNLRKFISGVSALAIAASAFAGMAVTASAADTTSLGGSYDEATNKFTWTFPTTEDLKADETYSTVADDEYADLVIAANTGDKLTGSGVYWNGTSWKSNGYTISYNRYVAITPRVNGTLNLTAATGAPVAGKSTTASIYYNSGDGLTFADMVATKNNNGTEFVTSSKSGVISKTGTIDMLAGKTYIIYQVCYYDNYRSGTISDLSFVPSSKALAGGVTVKYVDENEKDIIDPFAATLTSIYADDDYTHYFPKYVLGKDGKYYGTTESSFAKSVTLTAAAQDMKIGYGAADNVVYFQEAEDASVQNPPSWPVTTGATRSSGNSAEATKAGSAVTFSNITVSEDAEYTFSIASENNATYPTIIKFDGVQVAGGLSGSSIDYTISLKANTTHSIAFVASAARTVEFDYLVVTKTGSYASHNVTFADNAGTGDAVAYGDGVGITLPTTASVPEYKVLSGWNDGTTTFAPGAAVVVSKDVTYTAEYADAVADKAFTFETTLSEIADKSIYVTRSSDGKPSNPIAISSLADGTKYYGAGAVNLAIIFEDVPASWGTLSCVVK